MKLEAVLKMLLRCLVFVSAIFFYSAFMHESELEAGRQIVHELNECQEPQPPSNDTETTNVSYAIGSSPCDDEELFETQIEVAYDHYAVSEEYGRVAAQMAFPLGMILWLLLPLLAILASRLIKQNAPPP